MTKKNETLEKNKSIFVAMSNQDPFLVTNIVSPEEKEIKNQEFIAWGANNDYPKYLLNLFMKTPVLNSLINSAVDYTCGDDAVIAKTPFDQKVNDKDETINTLLRQIVYDYWIYGAFAVNVVRNKLGTIAGLYYVNVKNLRSDKKNERFWYSADWEKSYGRVKSVEYPKYDINSKAPSSILYVKNNFNNVYGVPVYGAATISAEILRCVDEYHLNNINNGFFASYIISFNNGQPTPEIQEEIEEELNEKFSGYENSGRIMCAFNKSKDNAVTVEKLDQGDNIGDRYKSLVEWAQQQLFTAFRCAPMLAGIMQDNNGFADEDFKEAYKLFNRTVIRPTQRLICDAFKAIFGEEVLTIKPFTIDWGDEGDDTNVK